MLKLHSLGQCSPTYGGKVGKRMWILKLCQSERKCGAAITNKRGGSGNLHSGDKWNFCLTLA